jgi:hypothetical protein
MVDHVSNCDGFKLQSGRFFSLSINLVNFRIPLILSGEFRVKAVRRR